MRHLSTIARMRRRVRLAAGRLRPARGMARAIVAVVLLLGGGGADGPPIDAAMDAPWDAAAASCGPTGGCAAGPACGASCCATGERCDPL